MGPCAIQVVLPPGLHKISVIAAYCPNQHNNNNHHHPQSIHFGVIVSLTKILPPFSRNNPPDFHFFGFRKKNSFSYRAVLGLASAPSPTKPEDHNPYHNHKMHAAQLVIYSVRTDDSPTIEVIRKLS
jgi:hypothetical protein